MLRVFLSVAALVVFCLGTLVAADDKGNKDNKNAKDKTKATITKVDAKKGTITLKMKDKNGKEEERTFKLAEDIRYFDSTGKAAIVDVFQSGDEVLVVEEEGRLREVHKNKAQDNSGNKNKNEKKSSGK